VLSCRAFALCKSILDTSLAAALTPPTIAHERRTLIANLLRERIFLRSICRAVGMILPTRPN